MRRQIPIILALAASSFLVACGASGGVNDPASPLSSATTNGLESGAGPSSAAAGIVGTVSALTGACPSVKFALEGKTISTSAETRYEGGACADVKNGSRVKVVGAVQSNGSVAAQVIGLAVATTPTAPIPPKDPAVPSTAAIKGTVNELAGTCPTVSLKLEGRKITTSATTRYEGGVCTDLKNGALISVTGTVQPDGSIVALSVGIAAATPVTPAEPKPTPTTATVSVKGTVNDFAGSCPVVSFRLEAKKVITSAATRYENGVCADVKSGVIVAVTGTVQVDGSIQAVAISVAR